MDFHRRTTTIWDINHYREQPRKTEKYARKFKNQSYNNFDEEVYSRTPNLYINCEFFEEMKKDVKKLQRLLGEIIQNIEQFSEHLQEP